MPLKISKKSLQPTPKSNKSPASARVARHRKMVMSVLVGGGLLIVGLAAVIFSVSQSQDLRQQASTHKTYACSGYGSSSVGCGAEEVCVSGTCVKNVAFLTPTPTAFPAGYCDAVAGVWGCQLGEYCHGNKCERKSGVECDPDAPSQCNSQGDISVCSAYTNKSGQTLWAITTVYCWNGCSKGDGGPYCTPARNTTCVPGSSRCNSSTRDPGDIQTCAKVGNSETYAWKNSPEKQCSRSADCRNYVYNGIQQAYCNEY